MYSLAFILVVHSLLKRTNSATSNLWIGGSISVSAGAPTFKTGPDGGGAEMEYTNWKHTQIAPVDKMSVIMARDEGKWTWDKTTAEGYICEKSS